ncbi:MAG: tandem-95 repeat protein [Planctomycetota bacterium]
MFESIVVDNFHSSGGLKLRSRPDESLVVKLAGSGTPNSDTIGTGFTATGTVNDATDRLGGQISILGLPDAPVVLTSFRDDSVGAGLRPDGSPFTDNNGDKTNSRAESNDWRSVYLAQNSTDRNVDIIPELELSTEAAPGLNGNVENAQLLGELAGSLTASDEVQRLGFEVEGFLSNPNDVDIYSFIGRPGTEVWIDIDKTSFTLDSVIELLDENGQVLARSNDSGAEIANGSEVDVFDPRLDGVTTSLQARDPQYSEFGAGGVYEDFDTANPRDAGIHFTLTGNDADPNARSSYFFRVRSASINPDDVSGGLTRGGYRFQVRLTEDQEFPGSVIRYSDIRYANHGIHVQGLLGTSPLLGEAGENEAWVESDGDRDAFRRNDANNDVLPTDSNPGGGFGFGFLEAPHQRPQNLGNLTGNRNNVISVAGGLSNSQDVDFYQIDVFNDDILNALRSTVFDVDYAAGFNRPDTNISVFYDPDGEFDNDEQPRLVLFGSDSNVLDDLTSPNGENDDSEKLDRGSISSGDPLIGPVTLVEGTYYVAITADGVEPEVFVTDPLLRREPVNSVRRLVEERYDAAEGFSTASGPVVPEFFPSATLAAGGFVQTGDLLPGHGRPTHFDGSFGTQQTSSIINEFAIAPGDAADIFGGPFRATEIDTLPWELTDNNEIGGQFVGFSENTSTSIPHVSIDGFLGGDRVDFYEFTVPEDGSRVILDVDHGFNSDVDIDSGNAETPFDFFDPTSIDTTMYLFRENTVNGVGVGTYQLIRTITDSDTRDGRLGSDGLVGAGGGSTDDNDPFFDSSFDFGNLITEGVYVVGIAQEQVAVSVDDNGFPQVADTDPLFGPLSYRLHVSVEDHPLPDTGGNQVIHFDRNAATGTGSIISEAFDLSGYAEVDLPTFYFNSRYSPLPGDSVSARIFSDQDPNGRTLNGLFTPDNRWQQTREDIRDFAGDSGVRVEFSYSASTFPGTGDEGLYLDDFIVGFAERGETVFNASGDGTRFNGFGTGGDGEYQLEVRPATEYSTAGTFAGSVPTSDFDTNDRHNQSITIVAPAGSQLTDGDTFVIGDGGTNRTFEFTTTAGSVQFGNTPILFDALDTPSQIAESIRDAIAIQSSIDIEASSSGGEDTGTLTDGRLALSGSARGSFLAIDSPTDAPAVLTRDADGNLLLPAILHDGIGDSNYLRTQGQVIIDSNRISDVRAIGIWSEPGIADIDPEDRRDFSGSIFGTGGVGFNDGFFLGSLDTINGTHAFLEFPPVGNSYPGVARNLPTLNDSVEGGLAPGVVVVNNTIDNAGFAGVKVDGETAPFVLDVFDLSSDLTADGVFEGFSGDVLEGSLLEIDAGGTRVTFEFDELNGNPTTVPLGSDTDGSNGVADGHVPIYYREDPEDSGYNRPNNVPREGYSSIELAISIMGAIQGSALVTNGLVELVTATMGPSPYRRSRSNEALQRFNSDFDSAAIYLQGVSNVRWIPGLSSATGVDISQAPVHEPVQPFARIVNNTIYGSDGRESAFPDGNVESNDLIVDAIDTKVGPSHRNVYTSTATLGDNVGPVGANGDVDFYQVNLGVGDRLIVDIDSEDDGGADTAVQIFNARGERQSFIQLTSGDVVTLSSDDTAPDYLDPLSTPTNVLPDADNTRDPFVDFFAPEKGTYFVAVSGENNVGFEPDALSGREGDDADLGLYTIQLETYAPRTAVISADGGAASNPAGRTADKGIRGSDLIGTSFTVTQIPDFDASAAAGARTNQVTYTFGGNIPLSADARMADIMRAIADGINNEGSLLNNDSADAPGPISAARVTALGGAAGDNAGINNLIRRGIESNPRIFFPHRYDGIVNPATYEFNTQTAPGGDQLGFGHNQRDTAENGTTEMYVFFENIAKIELSPEAEAAGLRLDPVAGFDTDQIINETGVLIGSGASPAILNNVFVNLHESVVVAESRAAGFGTASPDVQNKPQEAVVVGSVFHFDEGTPHLHQSKFSESVGLTTSTAVGPSNVNGGTDDFNVITPDDADTLVNPAGDNFLPAPFSPAIDSNIDSLIERSAFANLKQSVGIPISNVLAPLRDVTNVLRADNPLFSNTGQGSSVFGDRGSEELADFVGPVAISEAPRDDDAEGLDTDPNTSFINLTEGVYDEFRIQLRDAGDASDPFTGSGIDNNTVVVAEIPGVRRSGANVTLFEDDRLLVEGIDYTFNFDETKHIITLTPLAGIWDNDRAYRIQLNNADRTVVIAPDAAEVSDGEQVTITDSTGGQVVFEFESGFQIQMPEPITLEVPAVGTNQGGLSDGGVFSINDGVNPVVIFEFDSDGTTVGTPVELPSGPTPVDEDELEAFLTTIANNIATAVQGVVDDPNVDLDVDVRVVGTSVIIGSEQGTRADTSTSGLGAAARTLGLQVPSSGAGVGGVAVGNTFQVSDGINDEQFQFVDANTTTTVPGSVPIDITPPLGVGQEPLNADEVAVAIQTAIIQSSLNLSPLIIGQTVYLNLPDAGLVSVPPGQFLRPVSVSRVPVDGEQIVFTPNDDADQVVFELNRTDERQIDGTVLDDGVDPNNIPINLSRTTTGEELAGLVANAIRIPTIAGLSPNEVSVVPGALLTVGGEAGLGLAVSGESLQVIGSPDVTGPSTLEIFGPLLLQVPFGTPTDGDFIILTDDVGNQIILEFDDDGVLNQGAGRIGFAQFDDVDTISLSVVTAINASASGITASYLGSGQISLGRIQSDRVDTGNSELTTQRGVVSDGEVLTIRQGDLSVSYEFEAFNNGGGVTAGNISVPFNPAGSPEDVAGSLASAINSNNGGLNLSALVDDEGRVALQDLPGTLVDVTQAPTLILTGVPGGAIPVRISPAFTSAEVKQALLRAINSVNQGPAGTVTTLQAADRGGETLFVENGLLFDGPITTFFLPAIRDIQGQPLRANRADSTTQFTILMPTAGLDFGDAADPINGVPGRYPTALENDGARHIVGDDLFLGTQIDADPAGLPSRGADADDSVTDVSSTGTLFSVAIVGGDASVNVQSEFVDPATRDGDTVTINTGISTATLEFDLDGRFNEDHFAIQPTDAQDVNSILAAMIAALEESPVRPAGVNVVGTSLRISGDDEDGVSFVSDRNPSGVLNPNTVLPITVSVTGGGVLQGWIDYDSDGDWEAEEQILFFEPGADPNTATPRDEVIFSDIGGTQTFTLDTYFPASSPDPLFVTNTTARFRVSRSGGLTPTGLALSGEVEDYELLLVPGTPPTLTPEQANRSFTVDEDRVLQALDTTGVLTAPTNDDGLLAGIVDPEGDLVAILPEDTGVRDLFTPGGVAAGQLNVSSDGTFTFTPAADFVGSVSFTARVTDLKPQNPASQLVNATPITVVIDVLPVNDPPVATSIDVIASRTIDEDEVIIFTAEELIDPFYVPGPDNEAGQLLVFRSVSSPSGADSLSLQQGTLEIQPDGRSVRYTPPADYNGPAPDVFNYVVADVPGGNQISEAAAKLGTVSLTFNAVNDPPVVGTDLFNAVEDTPLQIAINGGSGVVGILDNDTPGPQNEIDEGQTILLTPGQFPVQTQRGGRVDLENGLLVYRPPALYSGPDNFNYSVSDSEGAVATGVVSLDVGGQNNGPIFVGVNGDANQTSLEFPESKPNAQSDQFDLSTWFTDPENDVLSFTVSSSNDDIVEAELDGTTLTLTREAFVFGTVQLTITASDPMGASLQQIVPVTIENENDPPSVISSLDPLSGLEDQTVIAELSSVFRDPDGDSLTYSVTRLDTLIPPTAQQIIDHPLIQSITFVGDQLQIVPEPNQFGSAEIEIEASDGSFFVTDFFTLDIASVEDAPVAVSDAYNVALGSTLRVLNPADGLLRNDSDADGDSISVDLFSVTQPNLGSLSVNEEGTFTYINTSGIVGQVDSFQYRTVDSTGRISPITTVALQLTRSQYQNPIQGNEADVTADGFVSPIDALRVINFLQRQGGNVGAVPVSEIGAPPPDFLDVNGDGFVSASDALAVINQLAANANGGGEGEQISMLSSTTAFAAASSDFLPTTNAFAVTSQPEGEQTLDSALETTDALLTSGLTIASAASETAGDQLVDSAFDSTTESSIDDALTDWEDELDTSLDD